MVSGKYLRSNIQKQPEEITKVTKDLYKYLRERVFQAQKIAGENLEKLFVMFM